VTGLDRWLTRSPLELQRLQESVWLFDSLMLAVEAQHVISLRLAAIARGGTAAALEARLMVTEKMIAARQVAGMLAQGASTEAVISFYRSQVRANVRRLTQKPRLLRRARQKVLDTLQAFGWSSRNRVLAS
jgi:nanoRNase/pAp phosphatase (c-di-AMP/oligoRNAs hydrolase)